MFGLMLNILFCVITFLAIYLFFSTNTIYSIMGFLAIVLALSILLLLLGAEFFAIIYLLIYIGLIIVFFLFVIMLVNIRRERQVLNFSWNLFIIFTVAIVLLNFFIEYYILADFFGLEKLIAFSVPENLQAPNEFWWHNLVLFTSIKTLGFYLFCKFGFFVCILGLILFMVLFIALNLTTLIDFYKENKPYVLEKDDDIK